VKRSRKRKECERDFEIENLQAFGVKEDFNNNLPFVSWVNERKNKASLTKK